MPMVELLLLELSARPKICWVKRVYIDVEKEQTDAEDHHVDQRGSGQVAFFAASEKRHQESDSDEGKTLWRFDEGQQNVVYLMH